MSDPKDRPSSGFILDTEVQWEMERAATRGQLAPYEPAPAPVSPPPTDESGRLWLQLMRDIKEWAKGGDNEFSQAPMDDIYETYDQLIALGEAGLNECLYQLGRREAPSEALDLIKRFAKHAESAELRARAHQIIDAQKPRT